MLKEHCRVDVWESELPPPRADLLAKSKDCDAILSLLTDKIDAEFLDNAPKIKVAANMAVGFDNIDLRAARERSILVSNTPGVLTETTAEFAWALMMAAARRVVEGDAQVRAGKWRTWEPEGLLGYDLYGATLGLVGYGRIGQSVARMATGFGMKVIYFDPEREGSVPFDTVLAEADFISLHVPLTPETRNLIGRREIRKCKKTAIIVNTSRGGVIDQDALAEELAAGTIFSAGLDVFEKEPLPPTHPLCKLSNVVLAPHIASASRATRDRMAVIAATNLLAGLKGEAPPNPVT